MKIASYTVMASSFQMYFDHDGCYESWARFDHDGNMLDSMFYPDTSHAARQATLFARARQQGFIGYKDLEA